MKVLVIGSGGREHAIAWKLRQSSKVTEVFSAPGNAGTEALARNVPVKSTDVPGLLRFAQDHEIDLTVVGPEQPLVLGIVDVFRDHGLAIFGPTKAAARLEGSKSFAKDFMTRHRIPTARHKAFVAGETSQAASFIRDLSPPIVVKADGLAAGKGVIICESRENAMGAVREMTENRVFGAAGEHVVIEEFLAGEEASMFVITDGKQFASLAPAQDHKRILDGDLGKNTGGMGAYAPAPLMTAQLQQQVIERIVRPTLEGMESESSPYTGCLYVGLMITEEGPQVLEYNCRFGDPEAQVVIPLIDADFADLLMGSSVDSLNLSGARQHPASAVCVVMASRGYPDEYETNKIIHGLDSVNADEGEVVFHAGTRREGNDIVTAGGRVLGVTAIGYGHDLEGTIQAAYRLIDRIAFDGAYYRSDIGQKALKRKTQVSTNRERA